jgi:putative transposase
MPRQTRTYVPGLSVHVIHRGNNGTSVFNDDVDRRVFLYCVREASTSNGLPVHGYVLMSTHYHLLATPDDASALQDTMKSVGERYVRYFNRKYDRFGTLWGGRYRPLLVTDEIYWLTCLRYIEQNPVRARMVSTPDAYRWSSYRAHALGERAEWLVPHPVYMALGRTDRERETAYRVICGVMLTDGELAVQRHPEPLPSAEANSVRVPVGV